MVTYKILVIILLIYSNIYLIISDNTKNVQKQLCASHENCKSCIQTPSCIWCEKKLDVAEGNVEPVRCIPRDQYNKHWCPVAQVINETTTILPDRDDPLTSGKGKEPVQVRPQQIRVRLRKGEEARLKFQYKQAEDYPVDMYYLMDLSASMHDYRRHLSEMGADIANTMQKLTANFKLGFGSFVDKVILPMTDTQPAKLQKPCTFYENGVKVNCTPPYGYKHQMPLSSDPNLFSSNVNAAPISGNLDAPEGGFDAIMQAIVCKDRIGWRSKARRLLVFSTDASFHLAGDGKLAGIIEPNDCQCHLDEDGYYTHSLLQDYPSISQINRKVLENNIHMIFAVPKSKNTTYQSLSQSIAGAAIGIIEKNDTVNVINLIKGQYEKLVENIQLIDNAPKHISVQYFTKCLNKSSELVQRSTCEGLHFEDTVEFDIVLKALECPSDGSNQHKIEIKPRGLNESLTIDLELICDCPCGKPTSATYESSSKSCNGHGDLVCGVCSCSNDYRGKYCDCHRNSINNNNNKETGGNSTVNMNCRASVNDTVDCSGHGTCKCGSCECDVRHNPAEKFGGKFCECNNFSCPRKDRALCGNNGDCVCGTCDCYPHWSGEDCGCHDNTTCFPPAAEALSTEICNGRGDCHCGKCHCKPQNDQRYSGLYCQDCTTCSGLHCEKLRNCVECLWSSKNPADELPELNENSEACNSCHDEIDIEKIDKVDINQTEYDDGIRMCRVPSLNDGCTLVFKYKLIKRGDISIFKTQVQKNKECPATGPLVGVAIGVVVMTVILGLLGLLIWKIVTVVHDEREYAKFERERATAKWQRGENPLYKGATTTFCNPTFVENCK